MVKFSLSPTLGVGPGNKVVMLKDVDQSWGISFVEALEKNIYRSQ